jgi:hypothetical protein
MTFTGKGMTKKRLPQCHGYRWRCFSGGTDAAETESAISLKRSSLATAEFQLFRIIWSNISKNLKAYLKRIYFLNHATIGNFLIKKRSKMVIVEEMFVKFIPLQYKLGKN